MKKILSMNAMGGVVLATVLFASSVICSPTQIQDLLRSRREALAEPEPEGSTGSDHADHDVKCEDGDNSALMKSCPNNDTCPMDDMTIEKCCHCLSVCCEAGSSDGMSVKNGTEGSAEPEPGKGFGSKVKDAFSSAEGWLKNQGHNIKSSLDKAADNVKQYASDVKDKVQDGIKSITGKGKNDTKSGSDCMSKDGKCSTDMSTDSGSTEDSSSDSTPVPGMQKSKREASADMDSSSTTENTPGSKRNKRGGPAWNMSTESPSNTSKPPERRKRASGNDDSTSTTEANSPTGKRDKRASGSDMMTTTEFSMTTKREKRAAGAEVTTENSTGSSGREKRGTDMDQMQTTEMSSSTRRTKRASGSEMSTESSSDPTSTAKGSGGGRSRRAAMKMGEMSTMAPDATSASSGSSDLYSISLAIPTLQNDTLAGPEEEERRFSKSPGINNTFVGASVRVVASFGTVNGTLMRNSGRPSGTMFFPTRSHSPRPGRRGILDSNPGKDDNGIIMGQLSISVYSGNESLPTMVRNKDVFGNGVIGGSGSSPRMAGLDLSYRQPTTTSIRSGAGVIVISEQSPHDTSKERIIGLDLDGTKPGNCQPLSLGVTCSPLQPDAVQCSVDSDCLGTKKCCFSSCHPHEDVGICEHPVSTPV